MAVRRRASRGAPARRRSGPTMPEQGDLAVAHLLVETQRDRGALAGGQARQHVEELVGLEADAGAVGVAGVLGARPGPL